MLIIYNNFGNNMFPNRAALSSKKIAYDPGPGKIGFLSEKRRKIPHICDLWTEKPQNQFKNPIFNSKTHFKIKNRSEIHDFHSKFAAIN